MGESATRGSKTVAWIILVSLVSIHPHLLQTSIIHTNLGSTSNAGQSWSFSTFGSVYTAPLVVGGYVYANSYFDQSALGGVYCLNASTGRQSWNYTADGATEGRPLSIVADDKRVYLNTQFGHLHAFDAYTGVKLWSFPNIGYGNTPAPNNGRVYVASTDDNVYALDASTGAEIWNHTVKAVYGQPVVTDGSVYVTSQPRVDPLIQGMVYSLDESTGNEIWKSSIPDSAGSLVVSKDSVYLSSYSMRIIGLEVYYVGSLHAFNSSTGSEEWNCTVGNYYERTSPNAFPVVQGQYIYLSLGNKTIALDASKGIEKWSFSKGTVLSTPTVVSPNLYLTAGADIYCLDASSGAEKWTYNMEGERPSNLVIDNGQLYVGSADSQYFAPSILHNVYAFDSLTGRRLWNYTIEGNANSIAMAGQEIYVGAGFATSEGPDFEGNGAIYALNSSAQASSPQSPVLSGLEQAIVVSVVVIVISAVLFIVYAKNKKKKF